MNDQSRGSSGMQLRDYWKVYRFCRRSGLAWWRALRPVVAIARGRRWHPANNGELRAVCLLIADATKGDQ
jgi:hypothetical protein